MSNFDPLIEVASRWRDPEHSPRQTAIDETLSADNRWTEQALNHALNRWMQRLTVEALERWLSSQSVAAPQTVGVIHGEEGPLAGIRCAVAVWAYGFDYVGAVPNSSPALLPRFGQEVAGEGMDGEICFASVEQTLAQADAVLAGPIEGAVEAIHSACEEAGIPASKRILRPPVYSIGVVDGHESDDEMERLAEDMLLYEGNGRRRLAVLWAPQDHEPDPYLEAMARFRGLFPAHEDTPGTLQMQQAFLEARDEPHAYADGLEFLMSRGEPEPQRAGHIRWAEYDNLETVDEWWSAREEEIYSVIARPHLHDQCPERWPMRTPGGVHVPPLDDEEGRALVRFLRGLDSD